MQLKDEYLELCELHKKVSILMKEYYRALFAERGLIKKLKEKYRPNENYTKWACKARRLARKNMNRVKGQRMVVDHIKPLLLCFLEGLTPEEASRVDNLQLLSKKANKDKSYLFDN
jgi:hypothetical protein